MKAQSLLVDENKFETNWNVSVQAGTAALFNEIKTDLSGTSDQMNNLPGFVASIQLAKMAFDRFDIGMEFSFMSLLGHNNNPLSIPFLNKHPDFNNTKSRFLPYPVEYKSNISTFSFFSKYNFINFSSFSKGKIKQNFYIKAGLGISFMNGEFGYREHGYYLFSKLKHPLYAVNRYGYDNGAPIFIMNSAVGLHYQISARIFVYSELSFQSLSTSLTDILPNFDNQLHKNMSEYEIDQHKLSVFGFSGRFMLGTSYYFNFNAKKGSEMEKLPFQNNLYRSYQSTYQTPVQKKPKKDQRLFHNKKKK